MTGSTPEPWSIPFPLEFVVAGTPVALGASASSKDRWKSQVGAGARLRLRELGDWEWLDDRAVAVTIFYFLAAAMEGDIDNIIKPILDAMAGIVYRDDRVVERVLAQRFEPGLSWEFNTRSVVLVNALDATPPVVYIRIQDDLNWRQVS